MCMQMRFGKTSSETYGNDCGVVHKRCTNEKTRATTCSADKAAPVSASSSVVRSGTSRCWRVKCATMAAKNSMEKEERDIDKLQYKFSLRAMLSKVVVNKQNSETLKSTLHSCIRKNTLNIIFYWGIFSKVLTKVRLSIMLKYCIFKGLFYQSVKSTENSEVTNS